GTRPECLCNRLALRIGQASFLACQTRSDAGSGTGRPPCRSGFHSETPRKLLVLLSSPQTRLEELPRPTEPTCSHQMAGPSAWTLEEKECALRCRRAWPHKRLDCW